MVYMKNGMCIKETQAMDRLSRETVITMKEADKGRAINPLTTHDKNTSWHC